MASTSTNKQPLFIDRVLHYVKDLDQANNGRDDGTIKVSGTNSAELLVDAISTDGAIVEDLYLISRSDVAHIVNLYLSTARDYLRESQASFIGSLESAVTERTVVRWSDMPRTLAPVPQVGDTEAKNTALYIPKGYALWAARQGNDDATNGPLIGCQGGWY
tara:strand:+ start:14 stop:496 length:483 start_codon:yes stop_codon:yes gene_type:complete